MAPEQPAPHRDQDADVSRRGDPPAPAGRLRVRLVQRAASLDRAENLAALEDLAARPGEVDLVVLPEASARDFGPPGSDLAPHAEPLDGAYAGRVRSLGAGGTAWLAGMFETAPDPARPLNTLVLGAGGGLTAYRKIHLYDSFGYRESDTISAAEIEPVVAELDGVRLGLMTCYDVRFPELSRLLVDRGADVLVVPAAWVAGERKVEHWRTLLRARAIENTVWVVGVGQPGPRYAGHSMVVAPDGDVVVEAGEGEEVLDAVVDLSRTAEVRRTNSSLANRRM
ncbi:carbon-nitrogen hydrolase family protein [Nocardioides korecus]